MNLYYLIIFFIWGLFMGSFYTVIGSRLPKNEDFIKTRSHCDACGHILSFLDMIPILSYLFLGRRCRYCQSKISSLSTWMEFFTGVLFALSYYVFGLSCNTLIALGIVSMLIILSVSDISYMIIPDEVLIFFSLYFLILIFIQSGLQQVFLSILSGVALFVVMYFIMMMGNYAFKKETLGGGDIKMMFVLGLIIHPLVGIFVIFLGSLLALPISLLLLFKKNQNLIPFGPFLLVSCAVLYFMQMDATKILSFFRLF